MSALRPDLALIARTVRPGARLLDVGTHGVDLLGQLGEIGVAFAQIAQGGSKDDWFIGFNIARKFY